MLEASTRRAVGYAIVLALGCAETDKSLGKVGQISENDSGAGGNTPGAGGDGDSGVVTSTGGSTPSSGGTRATGGHKSSGGASGVGGASAGGAASTGGASAGGTVGTGGASAGGTVGTGGTGGEPPECGFDCDPTGLKTLTWGPNGGLVAYMDFSQYVPCDSRYHHTRMPLNPPGARVTCYSWLPVCYPELSPVSLSDVLNALDNAEVKAALAQSGIIYGMDPRPMDGTVFSFRYGADVVYVGWPCPAGSSSCIPIPPGVAAFEKVLEDLDTQELALGN